MRREGHAFRRMTSLGHPGEMEIPASHIKQRLRCRQDRDVGTRTEAAPERFRVGTLRVVPSHRRQGFGGHLQKAEQNGGTKTLAQAARNPLKVRMRVLHPQEEGQASVINHPNGRTLRPGDAIVV